MIFCSLIPSLRFRAWRRCPLLLGLVTAAMLALAYPQATRADSMADVHKAISEDRMFDAFRELLDLAKAGNPEAQYELGGFYHWGRVGAADFTKARNWYQRSADQGNADAMIGLAVMNGYGQGGPVDRKTAVKWLMIASNSQKLSPDAATTIAKKRDELSADLTPAELATATAEAKTFQAKPEK